MANSIITRLSNGSNMQFSLNFTLGILKRTDVTARVGDEVDGNDDPVYRDIEWITDGLVNVLGTQAPLDTPVVFTRTVRKDQLVHDYANGTPIEELNLDESNKQTLMAMHEVLDGRFPEGLAQDLDMNSFRVTNLADGEDPQDAVTMQQLGDAPGYAEIAEQAAEIAEQAAEIAEQAAEIAVELAATFQAVPSTNSGNNYTIDTDPSFTVVDGSVVSFIVNAINTDAVNVNVNGSGLKSLRAADGSTMSQGELYPNAVPMIRYNQGLDLWYMLGYKNRTADFTVGSINEAVTFRDSADITKQFRFELDDVSSNNTRVMTIPNQNTTLIGKDTADTLTNKTFDTAASGNSFLINGVAVTANTGTGNIARATSPTFVTPVLGAASATSLTFGQSILNYYGEGTFTPTFLGASTPGTPTYTNQTGKYTRVGNMCKFLARLGISALGGMAGSLRTGGLPFIASGVAAPVTVGEFNNFSAVTHIWNAFVQPSTSEIWYYEANSGGGVTATSSTTGITSSATMWVGGTILI